MRTLDPGLGLAVLLSIFGAAPPGAALSEPSAPDGSAIFAAHCKQCHQPAVARAPDKAALSRRPAADIAAALTHGVMQPMAVGLTPADIAAVAAYLTAGQTAPVIDPAIAEPRCAVAAPIRAGRSDWPSMGVDAANRRFQPHPGLIPADLPRLKLKWAFALSGGGQPTVVGDWLFITNRSGPFYALDARTGCVHWVVRNAYSRTTPMVVPSRVSPSGWASFISQGDRAVHAYDAQSGTPLWTSDVLETHPAAVMTGSPIVGGDTLFVPISSLEEASAMSRDYGCCTFRGSLVALDLRTGKTRWRTYTIPEPAKPTGGLNAGGKALMGPAGAAIWSAPTLDPKRGLVYLATGDSYTDGPNPGSEAVIALEAATGRLRWRSQVTAGDIFVMGCDPPMHTGNCPKTLGRDSDFGASPVLVQPPGAPDVLVAGQKSGMVYGFDPSTGRVRWRTRVGSGSVVGGVEWGLGADSKRVYVPNSDMGILKHYPGSPDAPARPGLNGLDPETGKILWSTPAPEAPCHYAADGAKPSHCIRAQSAAPAVLPGLVFSGTDDGWLRAYDARTGKILWAYSTTARTYDTVNGVKAQCGGGIDGMGPTVAGGRVFTMSGYSGAADVSPGVNVLLAFGKD